MGGREWVSNSACKLVRFSLFAAAPGVNHDAAAAVLRNAAPPPRSHRHRHRHRVAVCHTFRFATENLLFPQVYETLHAQEKTILL